MINGVRYDTYSCEYEIFATIKKSVVYLFELGSNGKFHFSDGTTGEFYTLTNKRGLRMLCVRGRFIGSTSQLETYLIHRRANVTEYMNSLLK